MWGNAKHFHRQNLLKKILRKAILTQSIKKSFFNWGKSIEKNIGKR